MGELFHTSIHGNTGGHDASQGLGSTPKQLASNTCGSCDHRADGGSAYNTYRSEKRSNEQQKDAETRINKLQAGVDTANQAQAENTKQFLGKFGELSERVANLQTEVATEDLRKQAQQLQRELVSTQTELAATQKALTPEKAELEFSFEPFVDDRVRTLSLNRTLDNNYNIRFSIVNGTSADALDGDVNLKICDKCTFVKEPPEFRTIEGEPSNERLFSFGRILAKTRTRMFETTIHVDPQYRQFMIGISYRCKTCIVPALTHGHPPSVDLGVVDLNGIITGSQ